VIKLLKVITNYIPVGHPNRPGTKMISKPKARICHGTSNYNRGAGDEMHRSYVGRSYKKIWNGEKGKYEYFEADGKTPFAFGCTHVYIDKDSATIVIPLDEYCPGAGDRPLPYDSVYKGQKPLAKQLFNNQQNYCTWQYELCMDDMSASAWEQVLSNAIEFIKLYMPDPNIPDVRHYDVTGKTCPIPFVNTSIKEIDPRWTAFQSRIKSALAPDPLAEAAAILQSKGLMTSPDYWLQNARPGMMVKGEFAAALISNMANYIKKG
jgi:N-acetylmuramoyl-L-alanine amidase CwlA